MRLTPDSLATRALWFLGLLSVGGLACRSAAPPSSRIAPGPSAWPADLRAAVRAANRGAQGATWSIQQKVTVGGLTAERYRLGAGPELLLLPQDDGSAVTVQVWLPTGWSQDPLKDLGAAQRWAEAWPVAPLGPARPTSHWRGAARDLSGASWTVAADDGPVLVRALMRVWPTSTSTPSTSPVQALHLRMRRTYWDAVTAAPSPGGRAPLQPERAVWVVAGKLDRATILGQARAALPPSRSAPPERPTDIRPGPGPRVPLEVDAPPQARAALVAWSWADPSVQTVVKLRALAHLLTQGPEAGLRPVTAGGLAKGVRVNVDAGPLGASLEAFIHLGPTTSATAAAAGVRRALESVALGRTTGLQLESLQHGLQSERLRTWSGLETRAQQAAEAVLVYQDLEALDGAWVAEQGLEEPALRALAQALASKAPVIIRTRAP